MGEPRNISTKTTAQRMAGLLNTYYAKKTDVQDAIKAATYTNNTLNLYRTTDTTGTAAFSFNFPEEMFLDQVHTEFVGEFEWSSTLYPGSTDPNLDEKPVMVLAVKGDATNPTYSFLDMQALVDTYSAADASIVVSGYTIGVQIDDTAGNALTLVANKGLRVDISGKADKVSSAANGDLAGLDSNGNLTDSGVAASNVVTKIASPTANNLVKQDSAGSIADAGVAVADVQTKLATNTFTSGNIRTSDANGFAQDGGIAAANILVAADIVDYTEAELRTLLGLPAAE